MSASRANLRMVSDGPLERQRGDDRVDAAAVGQARVDHRRRLVDAPPDLGDDAVDDPQQVGVVEEGRLGLLDPAGPLDVDLVGAVDHHVGDARVLEVGLQRPVAEDVVGDLALELGAVSRAEWSLLGGQLVLDDLADFAGKLVASLEVEERVAEPGDAGPVDLRLQVCVWVACAPRRGAAIDLEPLGEERGSRSCGRSRSARGRSSPAPQAEAAVRDGLAGVLVGVRRREDRWQQLGDRT